MSMEMSEFLENAESERDVGEISDANDVSDESVELDVQKAVVESLAADKAMQDEQIATLHREKESLISEIETLKGRISEKEGMIAKLNEKLAKMDDVLVANSETALSNKVTLLDRETELPDRFEGETYDHVLEVIKEARDKCEAEGRIRRAQILEAVLVANEPTGNLVKRRADIEKLFEENNNILTGQVINELDKQGIPYKEGENYLLASEIIRKTF